MTAGRTLAEAGNLSVLMVCMGNICRSPTAEAMLRHKLVGAGLDRRVRVDSAGTHDYHVGEPPDDRAIAHGRGRGLALENLIARQVGVEDFTRFDYILAMDRQNLDWLVRHAPERTSARIELLLPYAPRLGLSEVPDPYYGGADGFERVIDLVDAACDGWIRAVSSASA